MRIEEKMLILPALYIINLRGSATTSELIKELTAFFNPTGEDAEILSGRRDTKFSQKVRNLKSHRSSNTMAAYTSYVDGTYSLTKAGEGYLSEHIEELEYLFSQKFKYKDIKDITNKLNDTSKKIILYEEYINEGTTRSKNVKVRERSGKLRDAAIAFYSQNGKIRCAVCDFCFEEMYGELGQGFIEIHHEKPIFQYDEKGSEQFIADAIKNVKPVCPNCHRMLHRNSKEPLSIKDLKKIMKKPSSKK